MYEEFHVFQEGLEVENEKGDRASWFKQLSTLTRRSFVNMCRDVGYYWLRIIIYVIVSVCVGTIYFDVGTSYTAIFARGACGGFITGFMTFMTIGGFPSFIEEMKVKHLTLEESFSFKSTLKLGLDVSLVFFEVLVPFFCRCFTEKGSMGTMELQCLYYQTSSLLSHSWFRSQLFLGPSPSTW